MLKFHQFINEAQQEREGNIKMSTLGGGLQEIAVSFPTQRNPDGVGEVSLELYSKGPKTYKIQPTGDLKAQMGIINSLSGEPDKTNADAVAAVEAEVKQLQADMTADFLQLFSKLDEDIQAILKKYNAQ